MKEVHDVGCAHRQKVFIVWKEFDSSCTELSSFDFDDRYFGWLLN